MNVVDSSGWLEYFADGPNAAFFAAALGDTADLIVPVITVYEVFKHVSLRRGEGAAACGGARVAPHDARDVRALPRPGL